MIMETVDFNSFSDGVLPKNYIKEIVIDVGRAEETKSFEDSVNEEYSQNTISNKNVFGKKQNTNVKPTNTIASEQINADNSLGKYKSIKVSYSCIINSKFLSLNLVTSKMKFGFLLVKNKTTIGAIQRGNYTFSDFNELINTKKADFKVINYEDVPKNTISDIRSNTNGRNSIYSLSGDLEFVVDRNDKNLAIFTFTFISFATNETGIENKFLQNYNKYGPINGEIIYLDGQIIQNSSVLLDNNNLVWAGTYHQMLPENNSINASTETTDTIRQNFISSIARQTGPIDPKLSFMKGARHNPLNNSSTNASQALAIKNIIGHKKVLDIESVFSILDNQASTLEETAKLIASENKIVSVSNESEKFSIVKNNKLSSNIFVSPTKSKTINGWVQINKKNVLLNFSRFSNFIKTIDQSNLSPIYEFTNLVRANIYRNPESNNVEEQETVFRSNFVKDPVSKKDYFYKPSLSREEQVLYSSFVKEELYSVNSGQMCIYSFNDHRVNSKLEGSYSYFGEFDFVDGYEIFMKRLFKNFHNSFEKIKTLFSFLEDKRFLKPGTNQQFNITNINKVPSIKFFGKYSFNSDRTRTTTEVINNEVRRFIALYQLMTLYSLPNNLQRTNEISYGLYHLMNINRSNMLNVMNVLNLIEKFDTIFVQMLGTENSYLDSFNIQKTTSKKSDKYTDVTFKVISKSHSLDNNLDKKAKISYLNKLVDPKKDNNVIPKISFNSIKEAINSSNFFSPKEFVLNNKSILINYENPNYYYDISQIFNNLYGNSKNQIEKSNLQSDFGTKNTIRNKTSLLESLSQIGVSIGEDYGIQELNTNSNNLVSSRNLLTTNVSNYGTNNTFNSSDTLDLSEDYVNSIEKFLDFPQDLNYILVNTIIDNSTDSDTLYDVRQARTFLLNSCLRSFIQYVDTFSPEDINDDLSDIKWKNLTSSSIETLKGKFLLCKFVISPDSLANASSDVISKLNIILSQQYFILDTTDKNRPNDQTTKSKERSEQFSRNRIGSVFFSRNQNQDASNYLKNVQEIIQINLRQENEDPQPLINLVSTNIFLRQPIQSDTFGTNFARLDIPGVSDSRMNKSRPVATPSPNNTSNRNVPSKNTNLGTGTSSRDKDLRSGVVSNSPSKIGGY